MSGKVKLDPATLRWVSRCMRQRMKWGRASIDIWDLIPWLEKKATRIENREKGE